MLILNEQTIASLTNPVELTDIMERAMLAYADGDFIMPDRSHMDFDGNTLLLMPSHHDGFFGTKIVSLFPENVKIGEPVLYGTVILNDGTSGKPVAMFNGAKLTAVRTAAVGSAGIRHTAPDSASSLGVIGAGVQGLHQTVFACKNRQISHINIYDSSAERLTILKEKLSSEIPGVKINISDNTSDLCENSDIIITATNSKSAVLPEDQDILKGKSIIAIGSYKPDMVELPDALFPLLEHYFIDVDIAIEESGDLIHPMRKGLVNKSQIRMLSDAIKGVVNIDKSQTSVYKSVGMALFDLFAAHYLYHKALDKGLGKVVEF